MISNPRKKECKKIISKNRRSLILIACTNMNLSGYISIKDERKLNETTLLNHYQNAKKNTHQKI